MIKWSDIGGWFDQDNYDAIKKIKLPKNPLILELGSHKGKSATALREIYPDAEIHTCDPGCLEPDGIRDLDIKYYNIAGYDLEWDKKLDLLFVDDDHTENTVKRDIIKYKPLIKKGGYMIFHDYCGVAGIKSAVDESLKDIEVNNDGEFSLAIWRNK